MSLSTPVAFLVFNRPDLTERVFEAIRQAEPRQLLVVADGPRGDHPADVEKCAAVRNIIDRVDWRCDVLKNFSDANLGCKRRVSSGLDWVFSQAEEAIILEDDCVPGASFFGFCQSLLERYRHDSRIMHIGGDNFQNGHRRTSHSYFFSKYNHVWGWATWRRAWSLYDVSMSAWPELKANGISRGLFDGANERNYWTGIFDRMYAGEIDSWAYAWTFACWAQNGLSVYPSENLVSNIGFRSDATHTTRESKHANLATGNVGELDHPPVVVRHRTADEFTARQVFGAANKLDRVVNSFKRRFAAILERQVSLGRFRAIRQQLYAKSGE